MTKFFSWSKLVLRIQILILKPEDYLVYLECLWPTTVFVRNFELFLQSASPALCWRQCCGSASLLYGSGSSFSLWCGSEYGSYLSIWCGSGSYISIRSWSRSYRYHSLFSRFEPSNAPKWPSLKLPLFHFDADPDPALHFAGYSDPASQNDADPDQQHWLEVKWHSPP